MSKSADAHGQVDPNDYFETARSGSRAERTFHAARLRMVRAAVAKGARGDRDLTLLDVGGGAGGLAVPLAQDGARVTGLDLSPAHIAALQAHAAAAGVAVTGVVGSGAALPFPDDAFDLVLLASVVHLMPEPGPLLREAERVCRRDGRILVAGPWRWHPKSQPWVKRLLGKQVETETWPFSVQRVGAFLLRSTLLDRADDRAMGYVLATFRPDKKPA